MRNAVLRTSDDHLCHLDAIVQNRNANPNRNPNPNPKPNPSPNLSPNPDHNPNPNANLDPNLDPNAQIRRLDGRDDHLTSVIPHFSIEKYSVIPVENL